MLRAKNFSYKPTLVFALQDNFTNKGTDGNFKKPLEMPGEAFQDMLGLWVAWVNPGTTETHRTAPL